ncbi:hypothetical protein QBC35DRAFT_289327 [Podospora australis]|uniref:Uncharacterized protein n=1 Tax=Podospora australis TaxID=1536484 RepID=A0AAN6WQ17_9PEZI|nr:hypothetical protein QBC35DRAFT_289327 [Podospora australis]
MEFLNSLIPFYLFSVTFASSGELWSIIHCVGSFAGFRVAFYGPYCMSSASCLLSGWERKKMLMKANDTSFSARLVIIVCTLIANFLLLPFLANIGMEERERVGRDKGVHSFTATLYFCAGPRGISFCSSFELVFPFPAKTLRCSLSPLSTSYPCPFGVSCLLFQKWKLLSLALGGLKSRGSLRGELPVPENKRSPCPCWVGVMRFWMDYLQGDSDEVRHTNQSHERSFSGGWVQAVRV